MKHLNQYMFALLAATLTLAACGDDDDFSAGQPSNGEGLNVYIDADASVVMESTATAFEFTVSRNKDTGAVTVPLSYEGEDLSPFDLPRSVAFAQGELTKTLTIACSDRMEMFRDYRIVVVVDERYTTQYAATPAGYPRATLDVVKEDYKPFANGLYTSAWTEEPEPAVLEYSEIKGCYRFKNATSGLFTYEFSVADKAVADEESDINGMYPITFSDDFVDYGCETSEDWAHPTYGVMTIYGDTESPSGYDAETKTYYFSIELTVSAGSFGAYYDTFEVTE